MINIEEHVYFDDPKKGHPDVQTYLKDVSYFFLGNGLIQAAVQYAPSNVGSQYGLLIMDPDKLGAKRNSITLDEVTGIQNTMLSLINAYTGEDLICENLNASWSYDNNIPVAKICWESGSLKIIESFYCKNNKNPQLIRKILISNTSEKSINLTIKTGVPEHVLIRNNDLIKGSDNLELYIQYDLDIQRESLYLKFVGKAKAEPDPEILEYWASIACLESGSDLINKLFKMSSCLLPSVISKNGKVDASIWQYNREWVRDHSYMAIGLILSGSISLARVVLHRLIKDFISDNGSPMDSSEERDYDEVELDQNGLLLSTIKTYYLWSGDLDFIRKNWKKIVLLADFPMKEVFYHKPSGMLYNRRDFWERHRAHGVEPGIELIHQTMVVSGLKDAAFLARLLSSKNDAERWTKFADKLKNSIFENPQYKMFDDRGFVKRRSLNSSVQEKIDPQEDSGLPDGVPLTQNIDHLLRPDTSCAIPIALGFIPPDSEIVQKTLKEMEILWNQDWDNGGYARYNYTSEADSSGPWPFSSLIVARANMEAGNYENVWRTLKWLNNIPGSLSGSWLELYGDRISPPYAQIGITPWTWGEIIMLVVQNIVGVFPEEDYIRIRPNLLPGMKNINITFPIRNSRLHINFKFEKDIKETVFICNSGIIKQGGNEVHVNYSNEDIYLEINNLELEI